MTSAKQVKSKAVASTESIPLCFNDHTTFHYWKQAFRKIAAQNNEVPKPARLLADELLRPEMGVEYRHAFFPLPPNALCSEAGFECLSVDLPTEFSQRGNPTLSARPMRWASSKPITSIPQQRFEVVTVEGTKFSKICIHSDSRKSLNTGELCVGTTVTAEYSELISKPPQQFRSCHTLLSDAPVNQDLVKACFPLEDVEIGERYYGLNESAACQKACDDEETCDAWTFQHAGTWNSNVASCCLFHGKEGVDFHCEDGASCCVSGWPKFKQEMGTKEYPMELKGSTKGRGGLILASMSELETYGLWIFAEAVDLGGTTETNDAAKPFFLQFARNSSLCLTTSKPQSSGKGDESAATQLWLDPCGSSREPESQQVWLLNTKNTGLVLV